MSKAVTDYLSGLSERDRKLLAHPEGRRILTKYDFRLFCLIYFRENMKSSDTGNEITFSEFHNAFIADASKYAIPSRGPAESRTAWICPRGSGKSTWQMFLIIWLAAHGHQKFVALFSATSTQAEDMLANIRGQFNQNDLLRADFPDLVRPATKRNEAIKLSDNKQLIMQENGFICTGRGITTSVLGMRINDTRPTMIVMDDIEAGESQTTSTDVVKLLKTVQDDIFPLSLNAHVAWVGTTTRPGGLTEQLVHKAVEMEYDAWVDEENFRINYWPALKTSEDGTKRSIWPERWTTEYLCSVEHTRSFAKNYMCLPAPEDFAYWRPDIFRYGNAPELDYVMLSVDPAVTVKESSDFTGLSVVGYSIAERKTYVLHCEEVKLGGNELRLRAAKLLEMYPGITLIYAETNMGGDLVKDLFKNLPVGVKTITQSVNKNVRAATALAEYEKGKVVHTQKLVALERQMISFPTGKHDDMIDSVGSAVIYFSLVDQASGPKVKVSSGRYN
jgi:predicted phage terminase large subunit-like protein